MSSSGNVASLNSVAVPELVPVQRTRELVGRHGSPVATQTVLSLGVRGELDVLMVAGRFVVTRDSIDAFRARHGLEAVHAAHIAAEGR